MSTSRISYRSIAATIAAVPGLPANLVDDIAARLLLAYEGRRFPRLHVKRMVRDAAIRAAIDAGESSRSIAARFGVSHVLVIHIGKQPSIAA